VVPTESVVVTTARGLRPRREEVKVERDTRAHVETCPFCRGNEARTPPTIAAWPETGPWDIRVVENLYPVLGDGPAEGDLSFGLQQVLAGYGRHEVVVDHPNHGIRLHEMGQPHLVRLLGAFRERMERLYAADARLRYVLVFKNFGPAAGASIPHTHSQIVATPVVPQNVLDELEHSRRYFEKTARCIFCALLDEALGCEVTLYDRLSGEVRRRIQAGQYVVERGERFVAVKPFASRYEWEVHVLPLEHRSDYLETTHEDLEDLARVLERTMARLDRVLGGVQYNLFLHTRPHGGPHGEDARSYHWHFEIVPRTSIPTGFELGSGFYVVTVSPEEAARQLRAAFDGDPAGA
jgi:UDPglucose--hexose-1-phosphate uridylyltransferase